VTVTGAVLRGVKGIPISVEVEFLNRLPAMVIVGLPPRGVKETSERVRSAIEACGINFPRRCIIVNLGPADVKKDGAGLDLPIALAVLAADGHIPADKLNDIIVFGELSLSGELRPARGVLPMALLARSLGKTLLVPTASRVKAELVPGASVTSAHMLRDIIAQVDRVLDKVPSIPPRPHQPHDLDLSDVRGQPKACLGMQIAAAGRHTLLFVGSPGCGKSMLARRMTTVLPSLQPWEALEASVIHDAAGLIGDNNDALLLVERPFRTPHHSITVAGMIGDRTLRPGEVSLAHHGVLFLDEVAEFSRSTLEALRPPLKAKCAHHPVNGEMVSTPADLQLVMATNPCPCGFLGQPTCRCTPEMITRYRNRVPDSDMQIELLPNLRAVNGEPGPTSASVRAKVEAARAFQRARGQVIPNAELERGEIEGGLHPFVLEQTKDATCELGQCSSDLLLKILRIARTVADLKECMLITREHIQAAMDFVRP